MFISVPRELFSQPYSTLLYSSEGELLGARIASDGQWRFPPSDRLPDRLSICLTVYEDRRFFYHPGVDPLAIARALKLNIIKRKKISGASTVTMQLARIARGNRSRNVYEKAVETSWALYLETVNSKRTLLNLYAAHAPFGGNVVGVETASWRYFGREASELSWAESATLAILPNSPALIHPARNRTKLKAKRDRLLWMLRDRGYISSTDCELACMEPLPEAPVALPDDAPHLLTRLAASGHEGQRIVSTVSRQLQKRTQEIVNRYGKEYGSSQIYNIAALIADVETGETLAYSGNISLKGDERRGGSVDIIAAGRSTGSLLKPFLYAGMLSDGSLLPATLIPDVPLNINGFTPQNFNKTFYGAVPAHRAIEQSLNVPLVRMLVAYNTGRFMSLLKQLGMTTLRFPEQHYGASLILGGAEGTLWDMSAMYASMARMLGHFHAYNGRYNPADIHPLSLVGAERQPPIVALTDKRLRDRFPLSAASVWFAFEAMSELNRPEEEAEWQQFASMKKIAWKTGTSYGARDAWAIGVTPRHVVGVWVGNASGEGRAGLTGVGYAAPVLFDLFSLLPDGAWFDMPVDGMEKVAVCRNSGHRASIICEHVDSVFVPASGLRSDVCPYHQLTHLSVDGRYRVNSSCEDVDRILIRPWFVLPPTQAYYYRNHHADYLPLPPFMPGCEPDANAMLEIIYPEANSALYLPKGFSGEQENFVFRAAHSRPEATVFWHVDGDYIGQTAGIHQINCRLSAGSHTLTVVDSWGSQAQIRIEVKSK